MAEDSETSLKRVLWRCRRGMRELDIILLSFAQTQYADLDGKEKAAFGRLLDETDVDLYAWFTGRHTPVDISYARLIERIKSTPHG